MCPVKDENPKEIQRCGINFFVTSLDSLIIALSKNVVRRCIVDQFNSPSGIVWRFWTFDAEFAYPDIRYPDLSVNFMAAKNPDILKWKSGCCGCLQQKTQLSPMGLRDALCQLKSCQLPRNSAETTCTPSPEQIEAMKLEG